VIKKIRYRFKTKKEFISEFGDNWRIDVPKKFPDWMDYLLGKEIDLNDQRLVLNYNCGQLTDINGELRVDVFNIRADEPAIQITNDLKISREMLTIINIEPSYKPKILKIEFLSKESFEITFLYIDKRMMSQHKKDVVYFNNKEYDFVIYSRRNLKMGKNSLRLPSYDKYEKNMKQKFEFSCEREMYNWLKKLHSTLREMNDNFTPFVKDPLYKSRPKKIILSGEYWIL
jgi:hypothetical protein